MGISGISVVSQCLPNTKEHYSLSNLRGSTRCLSHLTLSHSISLAIVSSRPLFGFQDVGTLGLLGHSTQTQSVLSTLSTFFVLYISYTDALVSLWVEICGGHQSHLRCVFLVLVCIGMYFSLAKLQLINFIHCSDGIMWP